MFSSGLLNNNSLSLGGGGGGGKHEKAAEELTKRFYLDAVLKSQMSPRNGLTKSASPMPAQHHIQRRNDEEEEEDEEDEAEQDLSRRISEERDLDIDTNNNNNNSKSEKSSSLSRTSGKTKSSSITNVPPSKDDHAMLNAMTPPRSPINSSHGSGDKQKHNSTPKAGSELRKRSSTDVSPVSHQDNPIDLSMKTSSSTASDENRSTSSVAGSDLDVDEERLSDSCTEPVKNSHPRSSSPLLLLNGGGRDHGSDDEATEYDQAIKRMKFQGTTPLDLTTKV